MPTYTERTDIADWLVTGVQKALDDEYGKRTVSGKLHLSAVLGCLKQSWRYSKVVGGKVRNSSAEDMTLLIGHAWDTLMSRAALSGEYVPHVVVYSDSLITELDGVGSVDHTTAIFENKTTRAGFKEDAPLRWPQYVEQVAGGLILYNKMHGARVTLGYLTVVHLYGDKLKVWELPFTWEELGAFSKELDRRAELVNSLTEPDETEHADWMCTYCSFATKKGGDCEGAGMGSWQGFFAVDKMEDA